MRSWSCGVCLSWRRWRFVSIATEILFLKKCWWSIKCSGRQLVADRQLRHAFFGFISAMSWPSQPRDTSQKGPRRPGDINKTCFLVQPNGRWPSVHLHWAIGFVTSANEWVIRPELRFLLEADQSPPRGHGLWYQPDTRIRGTKREETQQNEINNERCGLVCIVFGRFRVQISAWRPDTLRFFVFYLSPSRRISG